MKVTITQLNFQFLQIRVSISNLELVYIVKDKQARWLRKYFILGAKTAVSPTIAEFIVTKNQQENVSKFNQGERKEASE